MRVIIVEDEPNIANLINQLIEWEQLNISLLDICGDGLEAWHKIQQSKPDIVITDIRLPGIDGIELISRVRKAEIDCDFIVISGYSNFEYAQKAITYKVHEYLVKPIKKSELNDALQKVIQKRYQIEINSYAVDERKRLLRKAFMASLLREGCDTRTLEELASYDLNFKPGLFQCSFIKVDSAQSLVLNNLLRDIRAVAIRYTKPYVYDVVSYILEPSTVCLLCNYSPQSNISECYSKIYDYIRDNLINEHSHRFTITLGIGVADTTLANHNLPFTADHAIRYRLQGGVDRIYYYQQLQFSDADAASIFSAEIKHRLASYTDLLNYEAVKNELSLIFNQIDYSTDPAVIKAVCDSVIETIVSTLANSSPEINKQDAATQIQSMIEYNSNLTVTGIYNTLVNWCRSTFERITQQYSLRESRPVTAAKQYIDKHYASHLTLDTVANIVHLTPTYLSALFKKETGLNFSDYLMMKRIQVAKQLFGSTDMSVAEVGERVGYPDSRHFCKVFSKATGVKPSKYRNACK